jgi:ribosome biogenesis protein UTP30
VLTTATGKSFYKTTAKRPIPVVLMPARERIDGKRIKSQKRSKSGEENADDVDRQRLARPTEEIVAEVKKALGSVRVHLSPSTQTALIVGYAGWAPEKIAANIDAVILALVERFVPQKWKNVRSFYIKGPETAAYVLSQPSSKRVEPTC